MTPTIPGFPSSLPQFQPDFEGCRAMVFAIANHRFALPLQAIVRVISEPTRFNALQQTPASFILYRGHPLNLLNLYPLLPALSGRSADDGTTGQIAIVAQTADSGLWAILVDAPPALVLLPLAQVHPLPASLPRCYHQLADYIAVGGENGLSENVTLMNLPKAILYSAGHQTER